LTHKTRPRSGQMIAYRPVRKMGTTSPSMHTRKLIISNCIVPAKPITLMRGWGGLEMSFWKPSLARFRIFVF
ncbi:hypothetical protein, partial [Gluconobacter kondonii]|uniref:hypothetical protein n=1 Tax=Gluconobacter kondonii TaxID=941463 RepID=UPI002012886B